MLLSQWRGRTGCPVPELLLPALEGTLPEPSLHAVRAHVAGCPICTELAAALDDAAETPDEREVTRVTERVFRSRPSRASYRWAPLAAAAALAIVAGAAYVATRVERIPAPPVHSVSVAPARTPPRVAVLALAAPAIELPPESLALRSGARNRYAAALERALAYYKRGDYAVAAARLERVVRAHPDRPHAHFYLGAALLMRGDAAAAVRPLERARTLGGPGASLYPEATWYLAVALERSERVPEALHPLSQLCGNRGPRGEQACQGLTRLRNTR